MFKTLQETAAWVQSMTLLLEQFCDNVVSDCGWHADLLYQIESGHNLPYNREGAPWTVNLVVMGNLGGLENTQ